MNHININEEIITELTPYGEEILEKYVHYINNALFDRTYFINIPNKSETMFTKDFYIYEKNENKIIYKFVLWDFMHIFGKEMYMGNKNIIKNNLITFLKK